MPAGHDGMAKSFPSWPAIHAAPVSVPLTGLAAAHRRHHSAIF